MNNIVVTNKKNNSRPFRNQELSIFQSRYLNKNINISNDVRCTRIFSGLNEILNTLKRKGYVYYNSRYIKHTPLYYYTAITHEYMALIMLKHDGLK